MTVQLDRFLSPFLNMSLYEGKKIWCEIRPYSMKIITMIDLSDFKGFRDGPTENRLLIMELYKEKGT